MIAEGSTVWMTDDVHNFRNVIKTPQEIKHGDDEFVICSFLGYRTIGRLTGRTRRFFGCACPTIERFEIDTVVIDGALWGVKGERIAGTVAVHPERIVR